MQKANMLLVSRALPSIGRLAKPKLPCRMSMVHWAKIIMTVSANDGEPTVGHLDVRYKIYFSLDLIVALK